MHGTVFASGEWLSPDGAQAWLPSGLGWKGPGSGPWCHVCVMVGRVTLSGGLSTFAPGTQPGVLRSEVGVTHSMSQPKG